MRKNLFFILTIGAFAYSCTDAPTTENTKTENTSVINETSQPIVTTEKPIDPTPPDEDAKNSTPNDPLSPTGNAVVTKTDPPQTATAPRPSPDRTNVSPAREVATKTVAPTVPPATESKQKPPTRPETGAADTKDSPRTVVGKTEEKEEAKASAPPISSDNTTKETKPQNPPSFSHQAFDELLRKHVTASGKVNYSGIKAEKAKLEGYLENLKNNPPQSDWPKNQTMAYWVNAYNAFTIKLIVDNFPVASITKLEGGKPWDKKWINLGDKTYSLNNIENDILRPKYKDARIHFAVNCAAKSCPPLLNRAWSADNLNSNFEKQAKAFINNQNFNKISAGKIQVSKIFEWYAADFPDLKGFLNKYSSVKIDSGAKVEYLEYNWDLNE